MCGNEAAKAVEFQINSFGFYRADKRLHKIYFYGEFDPGSGRTLAACLTHASRTEKFSNGFLSGERVSNA